jgi:hypothetical protein
MAPAMASVVSRSGLPLSAPVLRNPLLPEWAIQGVLAPHEVNARPSLEALDALR